MSLDKGLDDILLKKTKPNLFLGLSRLTKSNITSDVNEACDQTSKDFDTSLDTPDHDTSVSKQKKDEKVINITWKPMATLTAAVKQASKKNDKKTSILEEIKDPSELLAAHSSKPPRDAAKERKWHDLPRVKITEELKRDLRLLHLRGAYDPKKFYKTMDRTKFPERFAIGTVENGSTDFYGGRLAKRERGRSLSEELLADSGITKLRKKRFQKLQDAAVKHKNIRVRKTSLKHTKQPHHRPKH